MRKLLALLLCLALCLACLPALGEDALTCGEYTYTLDANGNATLTGYTGAGGEVTVPAEVDGHPVTVLGALSFMKTAP